MNGECNDCSKHQLSKLECGFIYFSVKVKHHQHESFTWHVNKNDQQISGGT